MKKRTAFLIVILLLALAGCRVQPGGAVVTPAPTQSPAPTPEETAPAPTASATPSPAETELTDEPVPTGTLGDASPGPSDQPAPPEETGPLDEAGRYAAALSWCEAHKTEFSGYDLYHADRTYWFADYAPGVTTAVYEQGNAWFYEDAAGTAAPAEAAAILFQTAGACFETQEPEDWQAQAERLARRAAAEAAGDAAAVERWLSDQLADNPAYFVGLGEDMWLCGVAPQSDLSVGWYVLMRQGNVYRLQHDRAFGHYAQSPEAQVRIQFDKALEAWNWFGGMTLPSDFEDSKTFEDHPGSWYRVDYPGISTMLELRAYLKTLFSDEIVDYLLAGDTLYREVDGVLYVYPLDAGYPRLSGAKQVQRVSDTKLNYHMEGALVYGDPSIAQVPAVLDFPYELVGDKWVFTEFSWSDQ